MIDYINYQQVKRTNPKNKEYLKTTLTARLEFKDEVAPKDIEDVQKRLKWRKEIEGNYLRKYLKDVGKMTLHTPLNGSSKYFSGFEKKVRLKENLKKLKLDIKITSNNDLLRTDMFDLEALNTFILTGDIAL